MTTSKSVWDGRRELGMFSLTATIMPPFPVVLFSERLSNQISVQQIIEKLTNKYKSESLLTNLQVCSVHTLIWVPSQSECESLLVWIASGDDGIAWWLSWRDWHKFGLKGATCPVTEDSEASCVVT